MRNKFPDSNWQCFRFVLIRNTLEYKYSFQDCIKEKSPIEKIAVPDMGIEIFLNTPILLKPSIMPASSSSIGMTAKNDRIIQIPKGIVIVK